jgi:hypothetical protein
MRGRCLESRDKDAIRDQVSQSTLDYLYTMISTAILILSAALAQAHGDHSFDLSDADDGMSYAERHVCPSSLPRSLFG